MITSDTHETAAPLLPGAVAGRPLAFQGESLRAAKRFLGPTHRTVAPEETLDRVRRHFPTVGLTRLADVTGLDRIGIPTAVAHRPNSPTLSSASGKGFTREAAMASGAMEGIELHHAENLRVPIVRATFDELEADGGVIDRARIPLARRALFDARRPEPWIMGWDLIGNRRCAVPHDTVAMVPHTGRKLAYAGTYPMGSNGLASGNHILEAMCAGLLEVIERDAIACQWSARARSGQSFDKVRLDTIEHPMVLDLLTSYANAGIGATLYDYTVDTQIPVYRATIHDLQNRHSGIYSGYGAHLDPSVAMIRALTEAAQGRLVYINGARDDFFRHDLLRTRIEDNAANFERIARMPATVDVRDRPSLATRAFEDDVHALLDRLVAAGVQQAVAVDLTHDDIGVPVVRIVVPGLEGYMFDHYTPGPRARAFAAGTAPEWPAPPERA